MGDQWGSNPSYGYSAGNNRGYGQERRNYGSRDQQGGGGGGSRYFNRSFDGGDRNRGDFRNNRPAGGGGGGGFNNRQFEDGDATTIKVPTRFVGRIIGRGGSKINDLQYKSGARIQITKDTEGDDTFVKLFGNSGAVTTAQDLIGELTVDY